MFSFRNEAAIDEATLKSIRQRLQNTDKQSDANGSSDNVENIADYQAKKSTSHESSSNDIVLDDYELIDENDSWTSSDTYPINRPTYSPLEETAGFDEEDELVEYGDSEGHHGPSSEASSASYNNNEESDEAVEDEADYSYMTAAAFQSDQSINNNTQNSMKQQTIPSVTGNKEQVIQNPIEPIRMRSAGGQQYKMPAATPVINFSNQPEAEVSQIIQPEVPVDFDNLNDIDKSAIDYQNFASTDLPTKQDAQLNANADSEERGNLAWEDKSYGEEEYLSAPTETAAQDYTFEPNSEDFEPLNEKREEDPYGFTNEQEGINDDDFVSDKTSEDDDRDYGDDEDSYENENEYAEEDEDEEDDDMLQQTTKTALSRLREAKAAHNNRATDASSSAVTLQDFTASILEREIKSWLNANLPALVNQIVQEKIDKLTSE